MKIKKFIYAFLVIILIVVVFVFGLLKGKKETGEKTTPKPPALVVRDSYKGQLNIVLGVKKEDFNFPEELPLIKVNRKTIEINEARIIAKNLKFETEPTTTNDINEGTMFVWSDEDKFLFITEKAGKINYGLNIGELPKVVNRKLTDEDLDTLTKKFFEDNLKINEGSLKLVSAIPYVHNTQTEGLAQASREKAEVFQLNYTYSDLDYEVLSFNLNNPSVFIQVLPDGSVFNIQTTLETFEKSETIIPIKNYEDFQKSLNSAVLINLLNDYIRLSDIPKGAVKQINITKIKIAYLMDFSPIKELHPIFILEGDTEVTNSTANFAQLYLPAAKNP